MMSSILLEFGYRITLTTKKQKNVDVGKKMSYVNIFFCVILVSYSRKMVVLQCYCNQSVMTLSKYLVVGS